MWFLEKKVGFMKDQTFKTWGCWQRKSTMEGNIAGFWKRPRTCVHGCQRVFIEYIDIYDHSYIVQCWCLLCVGVIYIYIYMCVFYVLNFEGALVCAVGCSVWRLNCGTLSKTTGCLLVFTFSMYTNKYKYKSTGLD